VLTETFAYQPTTSNSGALLTFAHIAADAAALLEYIDRADHGSLRAWGDLVARDGVSNRRCIAGRDSESIAAGALINRGTTKPAGSRRRVFLWPSIGSGGPAIPGKPLERL
jgi:hypothetical protein